MLLELHAGRNDVAAQGGKLVCHDGVHIQVGGIPGTPCGGASLGSSTERNLASAIISVKEHDIMGDGARTAMNRLTRAKALIMMTRDFTARGLSFLLIEWGVLCSVRNLENAER